MEVKLINYLNKDVADYDDFALDGEIYIGPENEDYAYEVFEFHVISVKRLYLNFEDNGIMLNRGWMISKIYDEDLIMAKIESIVSKFKKTNDEECYNELGAYFIRVTL